MKDVGRNDPCPCGSGQKFKRCCLLKAGGVSTPFTRDERQAALGELFYFAERAEFDAEHAAAEDAFWDDRLDGLSDEEADEALQLPSSQGAYIEWFSFDFRLSTGRTLLDLFLERGRSRLRPGELRYLERMRPSHLRPYEVVAVHLDEGLDLVDLWTGGRLRIHERLAADEIVRWNLIAARVVPGQEGVPVMDGTPHLYPLDVKAPMLRALRRAHREFEQKFHASDLSTFFKRMGPLYHHIWLDHVALRPLAEDRHGRG